MKQSFKDIAQNNERSEALALRDRTTHMTQQVSMACSGKFSAERSGTEILSLLNAVLPLCHLTDTTEQPKPTTTYYPNY